MKHFYRIPILAAALLITVASAALAGQKNSTTPQKTSWFLQRGADRTEVQAGVTGAERPPG